MIFIPATHTLTALTRSQSLTLLLPSDKTPQLVRELSAACDGAVAAASFKHVSPAGAAIGSVPLTDAERAVYEVDAAEQVWPV